MEKTKYFSYKTGELCDGCRMCVKGEKLVLFITGVCPRSCYFCPLSDEKYHKDVMYANERKISNVDELIEEAKISGARGCGITGGDPLVCIEKTCKAIKRLKQNFKNFHIHLYTSLNLIDEKKIKKLEDAGLDEIRFHLDFDDESLWERIKINTSMSKGIEVPVIPGKNLNKMINFVKEYVDFINLNELEYADTEHNKLGDMKFETINPLSYAIKGSEEIALEAMEKNSKLNIHYCTAKLKNTVQFMNRITRRAKNVKKPYDIQKGPSLFRGTISGEEDLKIMHEKVSKLFVNDIDPLKKRLLCSRQNAKIFSKKLKKMGYKVEIVEELGTYDQFEIESEEL